MNLSNRSIHVDKTLRRLRLLDAGAVVAEFPVLVGKLDGPKSRKNDDRTPEGDFRVSRMLPDEAAVGKGYYKGLHISYPERHDIEGGFALGLIDGQMREQLLQELEATGEACQDTELGGWVAIHGGLQPDEIFERGTLGCVVMRSADMDVVYEFSSPDMPIRIMA